MDIAGLKRSKIAIIVGSFTLVLVAAKRGRADDPIVEAKETIQVFERTDPGISRFFSESLAYVVFPSVGKGGFGIGGAGGKGILFEKGKPVGKASLGQITVGLQAGGQSYSEVIFFETAAALTDFKKGNYALAAQVSAVAASAGAAAHANYQNGVAVFTVAKGGLMYEASVGGQKFKYQPFHNNKK